MKQRQSFRHLSIAFFLTLSVLTLGTIGYMLIEQLTFIDALYTTVGIMSTVGLVVHPMSVAGRIFSIIVILLGVGSLLYAFGTGMEFMLEGHLNLVIRRRLMENKIARLNHHAIICGFGRVGSQIVATFQRVRQPFLVIDSSEENFELCIQRGFIAILGDATSDEVLRKAAIAKAVCILVATDDDAHNISITLSARHLNEALYIVARSNHDETEVKLKLAGANQVISPYTMAGQRMADIALQPDIAR